MNWLLLFVPISLALEYVVHAPPAWVFVSAIVGIVPLAEWIRRATEHLAASVGSAIGGLLNVTFGNAAELIIALFVLRAGHGDVVKAQITGAIIGNSLLGLGLAIVAGSIGREQQTFSRHRAGQLGSMLMLTMIALMIPALFDYTERAHLEPHLAMELDERMSLGVSVVLIVVYVANLVYTLVTHKGVFEGAVGERGEEADEGHAPPDGRWSVRKSIGVLVAATALTALQAELVSGSLEATATGLGLTPFFLGITLLAVVGNAAEYISAVYFARRDQMGLVMSITVGSTIQIALLVAPLLVIVSYLFGTPMNLVFANPLELMAIAGVAFTVNAIAHDGETTWFEGVLLLAVYALLGIAFFYVR
ncbi:MAG TPA: calcium/proton exchanger [Gemmatimonadaceae bacterium]|nr:calcium/proton exchanger [Gemmatimonadaceae bacterium]